MNATDPEHPSAVLRELNSLRQQEKLTDVVLEVEGRSFPCHRAVLASCSPYFRGMFTSGFAEAKQDRITIGDVSKVAMATILDYAYTSCLETEADQVQAVMSAANLFQVDFVSRQAAEYMEAHLDVSNCADVLMYADMLGDSGLVETSKKYIASRFKEATLQPSFLQLSLPQLRSLLNRDDLITQSEDNVVEAALKWIDFNREERSQHLPALCKMLRHPFISSKQHAEVESRPLSSNVTLVYSENTTQRLGQKGTEMQIILSTCYFDDDEQPYAPCHDPSNGNTYAINLPDSLHRLHSLFTMVATPDGDLYLAVYLLDEDFETRGQCGPESETNKDTKFYLYNHLLRTWEPRCEMSEMSDWWCELVFLNGYIYAIGGDDVKGMAERYNPSRDEWTSIPPFPHPVSSGLCAVPLGDAIYVITEKDCHRFSTTENRWDRIADLVGPPRCPHAVAYHGRIYCVNFVDAGDYSPTYVEAYDPADGVWRRTGNGKSFVYNNGRRTTYGGTLQATLMTHMGTLYLFTVHIEHDRNSYYPDDKPRSKISVHQYQPETDSWVPVAKANRRRLVPHKICHDSMADFLVARMFPSWLGSNTDLEDF